jgi:hypothetical protein
VAVTHEKFGRAFEVAIGRLTAPAYVIYEMHNGEQRSGRDERHVPSELRWYWSITVICADAECHDVPLVTLQVIRHCRSIAFRQASAHTPATLFAQLLQDTAAHKSC